MNKIERDRSRVCRNWCSIDRLDGNDLKDGDRLILKWPDGQMQSVVIIVERKSVMYPDHGGSFKVTESHAYVVAYHRGVRVQVPIVGLEAARDSIG